MKTAIISDIHSNIEAFEIVLEYIMKNNIDRIICLGDLIGYGPNPIEVINKSDIFEKIILGNHEMAVLEGPYGFNEIAASVIHWTRDIIKEKYGQDNFIKLVKQFSVRDTLDKDTLLIHGSPKNPMDYILNLKAAGKALRFIEQKYKVCFIGHTHKPGIFKLKGNKVTFTAPDSLSYELKEDDVTKIINVGSVGQPRDGDIRSTFIVIEENKFSYVRLEYDYEKTIRKIYENKYIPNYSGDRLRFGG